MHLGDEIRISCDVTSIFGVLSDPGRILLSIKTPLGNIIDLTTDIVKDGIGKYHYDLNLTIPGSWWYKWQTLGENQAIIEDGFYVYDNNF
jgi:hypothetical protein